MLTPGPWRRGTNIDLGDDSYVTRSRCKTGYKIKRCCSRCGNWEIWQWNMLISGRYSSWSDAHDEFLALTHGQHDKMALGMSAVRTAVRHTGRHAHRPGEGKWDAEWLMFQHRWVLTDDSDGKTRAWDQNSWTLVGTAPGGGMMAIRPYAIRPYAMG